MSAMNVWKAADHPRIRGEHGLLRQVSGEPLGSSPHTRGAPRARHDRRVERGIIPAYAGSTSPAARGCPTALGSSPHTRGAPAFTAQVGVDLRIIPAYAGSTDTTRGPTLSPADHPRIRGEHEDQVTRLYEREGSSPHTRGALAGRNLSAPSSRIIPAYAGSTGPDDRRRARAADHPRIRGEHCCWGALVLPPGGSSPHTRGAPPGLPPFAFAARIIPAYAGSTMEV